MLNQTTKTVETTYEYDREGKMTKKKVVEEGDFAMPSVTTIYSDSNDTEIESGIELEGAFGMSPLEVFLTAAAGAVFGNLLYRVTHKN